MFLANNNLSMTEHSHILLEGLVTKCPLLYCERACGLCFQEHMKNTVHSVLAYFTASKLSAAANVSLGLSSVYNTHGCLVMQIRGKSPRCEANLLLAEQSAVCKQLMHFPESANVLLVPNA
jgi:hypothetical protein